MSSLIHYGTPRHSGRYPWGSGEDPQQHSKSFLGYVDDLKKQGMSEVEIAKANGMTVIELRNRKTIAKNEVKKDELLTVLALKAKNMSNIAIGQQIGKNESYVRSVLNPATQARAKVTDTVADILKDNIAAKKYIDVGKGVEQHLAVSRRDLDVAITKLRDNGYKLHYINVEQVGNPGKYTLMKVLVSPDTDWKETNANKSQIRTVTGWVQEDDNGISALGIKDPTPVDSKRIEVKYGPDGGTAKDGVIELRRGVADLSLGASNYAQVRIKVDDTHFLKGMAMYADDLPAGTDIRFNTNKTDTGNKLDAFKPLKVNKLTGNPDEDNPFGAVVRQKYYTDANGDSKLSPLNIVNEQGKWAEWSRSLSSQMLSKQTPALAKRQLGLAFDQKVTELDEISQLTNPVIKKNLLESFSDECDSSAVHLKAASLPRQRNAVILPIPSLKENEIFAPEFNNGEHVVLIRHPHGGIFEIPELVVNNKSADGRRIIGSDTIDAVGIHPVVAQKLSGADFDGDTVVVIPTKNQTIKTAPTLKGLMNFDPKIYKLPDDAPKMSAKSKGTEMGNISNLITDMTLKFANEDELARAVRHSMVVIDAEKHHLDYKLSAKRENIAELKTKYQKGPRSGADTIISKSSSDIRVPQRKDRISIDPNTGEKIYTYTDKSYTIPEHTKTGKRGNIIVVPEKTIFNKTKSTKMAEAKDAFSLTSDNPSPMEAVYATHANKLKALANTARKEALIQPNIKQTPSARDTYKPEVESLKASLNIALRNAPLERQAQVLARSIVEATKQGNPDMDASDIKKINGQALNAARERVGAKKAQIHITDKEWEAIQSGAISTNFLNEIINHADKDRLLALATPRTATLMTNVKVDRARAMLASGFTQAEVAEALGVSISTLSNALHPKVKE